MSSLAPLSSVLRIVLLGLLLLGVMVKPAIAFAGVLHEAEHALLAGQDRPADDRSASGADPADEDDPWHALMHHGHCCGQSLAVLPQAMVGSLLPSGSHPPPPLSVEFQPATHPVAFRPPITA